MNKNDLRVKKTREAINGAFLKLLSERAFDDITIADIIDRAGVNRSTFYRHYRDKNDLLNTFISDATEEYRKTSNDDYLNLDPENISAYHDKFRSLMEFFELHKEVYRVLWGANIGRDVFGEMLEHAVQCLRKSIEENKTITLTKKGYAELYARLFATNLFVMLKFKLLSDTDATVDDISATMTSHMERGIFASLKSGK